MTDRTCYLNPARCRMCLHMRTARKPLPQDSPAIWNTLCFKARIKLPLMATASEWRDTGEAIPKPGRCRFELDSRLAGIINPKLKAEKHYRGFAKFVAAKMLNKGKIL